MLLHTVDPMRLASSQISLCPELSRVYVDLCRHAAKWKPVGNILLSLVLVAVLAKGYGCLRLGVLWNWLRFYTFIWSLCGWSRGLPGWTCNLDDGAPLSSQGRPHDLRQGLSSST
ncbi:hypothetical protein BDR03DRAFT_937347 [Suillus americanus]|nr:hypothetical protein BDR03DRAFT_937347 [Suillus americanus]